MDSDRFTSKSRTDSDTYVCAVAEINSVGTGYSSAGWLQIQQLGWLYVEEDASLVARKDSDPAARMDSDSAARMDSVGFITSRQNGSGPAVRMF
jgi:hypothetical protein